MKNLKMLIIGLLLGALLSFSFGANRRGRPVNPQGSFDYGYRKYVKPDSYTVKLQKYKNLTDKEIKARELIELEDISSGLLSIAINTSH